MHSVIDKQLNNILNRMILCENYISRHTVVCHEAKEAGIPHKRVVDQLKHFHVCIYT